MLTTLSGHTQSLKKPTQARANIIHVATTGSDNTGDGTLLNPYATMTKAAKKVSPGDTVYVHGGTYHNDNFGNGDIWKNDKMAWIVCHGAPGEWITFKPAPGDTVLLEFDAVGIAIKTSSYVVFSGFEVKAMGDQITLSEAQDAWGLYLDSLGVEHDLAQELGIDIRDTALWGQTISKTPLYKIKKPKYYNEPGIVAGKSHHIIIENNLVRNVCGSAIRSQGSDYVTIRNNKVAENTYWTSAGVGAVTAAETTVIPAGDTFTGIKIIIEKNEIYNNANKLYSWNPDKDLIKFVIDEGSGIFLTRNNNTYDHGYFYIGNNISYLNGASGIVVHKTNRAIVENNTLFYNGQTNGDLKAGGLGVNTVDDVVFRNNICWAKNNKSAIYKVANPITNLVMEKNIAFNNNSSEIDAVHGLADTGWKETNPMLQDTASHNFRLKQNSPAIDSGARITSLPENNCDFYNNPRIMNGSVDIGAIESGKYWTGKLDDDWSKSENWSDTSAVTDTSVINIPSPSFYDFIPKIKTNTTVRKIFLHDSTTLIINNGVSLHIGP